MKRGSALAALAVAGLLAAAPASAQEPDRQPGAPVRLVPLPASPSAPSESGVPAGIGATALAPVDASWADALGKAAPPLPPERWNGMARATLRAMLPLLGPSESPALRGLARRLVLSGAAVPAGNDPTPGPSLVLLRAAAAARLGAIAGAKTVLDNVPGDKGEAGDQFRIELAFADNDVTDGCGRVAAGLIRYRSVWWDEANIACQLLSGARDKAALALDVLHDRQAAPDPQFDALVAAASGRAARLDRKAALTPLRATLWAASKRPLPADLVAGMDAATAAAFAGSGEPAQNRLGAAERAAALGAWPAERLAALYDKAGISDEQRAAALGDDKAGETPQGRAALYLIAQKDPEPAPRSAALLRFLAGAERHTLYFVASRLAAPLIVAIGPNVAVKSAAPAFIRAVVAAGRSRDAAAWTGLADAAAIAPLMVVVAGIEGPPPEEKAVGEALAALTLRPSEDTPRRLGLFLALASANGLPLGAEGLAAQLAPPHSATVPSTALWLLLGRAEAAHRRGETALAAVLMASDGAGRAPEPLALLASLAGLREAGLQADARALSRDVAIAAGL